MSDARHAALLNAARDVVAEKGRDASMLDVARRAKASKETLYAYFGDKRGLFTALVQDNAEAVASELAMALASPDDPPQNGLHRFAVALQQLLLGEASLSINRAAIAEAPHDPSLGRLLDANGRGRVVPQLVRLLEAAHRAGHLRIESTEEAASTLIGLIIGDQQIRRLLGSAPMPEPNEMEKRASRAVAQFLTLYAVRSGENKPLA